MLNSISADSAATRAMLFSPLQLRDRGDGRPRGEVLKGLVRPLVTCGAGPLRIDSLAIKGSGVTRSFPLKSVYDPVAHGIFRKPYIPLYIIRSRELKKRDPSEQSMNQPTVGP